MIPAVRDLAKRYPAITAWRLALRQLPLRVRPPRRGPRGVRAPRRARLRGPAARRPVDHRRGAGRRARRGGSATPSAPSSSTRCSRPTRGSRSSPGRAAACSGPVSLYLGQLAMTMSRTADAMRHFESAIEMSRAMGDRPFLAQARIGLAEALLARDAAGDRKRALELLGRVLEVGQELGMRPVVERRAGAAARGPGPQRRRRQDLDRHDDLGGRERAPRRALVRRPRRDGHDPLQRHRELDADGGAARRRALDRGAARPQLGLPRPPARPRRPRGQEPGRRLHARLPRPAPRGRVRRGDPARPRRAARSRAASGSASAWACTPARRSARRATSSAAASSSPRASPRRPAAARSSSPRTCARWSSPSGAEPDGAGDNGDLAFDAGRELELKGLAGTHRVFRARWEQQASPA